MGGASETSPEVSYCGLLKKASFLAAICRLSLCTCAEGVVLALFDLLCLIMTMHRMIDTIIAATPTTPATMAPIVPAFTFVALVLVSVGVGSVVSPALLGAVTVLLVARRAVVDDGGVGGVGGVVRAEGGMGDSSAAMGEH